MQGFVKNIMDEKDRKCKEKMLCYLGDLMEDTTDFSWGSAKSAHAVLMCQMERGSVDWFGCIIFGVTIYEMCSLVCCLSCKLFN